MAQTDLKEDTPFGGDVPKNSEEEKEAEIDFLKDDPKEMTWGRRIALGLINQGWYNPRAKVDDDSNDKEGGNADGGDNDDEKGADLSQQMNHSTFDFDFKETKLQKPSLEKGWAYFEHVALYRYLVEDGGKNHKKLDKAEPGENNLKTKLYDPLCTPHGQLGDFGLGLGLYFASLRAIFLITLIAGLVSIHNIKYFASEDYLPAVNKAQIESTLLHGSAICTNTPWVPCPNCTCVSSDNFKRSIASEVLPEDRCGIAISDDGLTEITVVRHNDCDGTPWQLGAVNYATVIVILLFTMGLGNYMKRQEIQFDEDEQTAQDYSVRVTNPPHNARDPEEWRRFFKENFDAQLTVCTCAVDNDLLVRTLVERRELLRTIENMLEPGTSMSNFNLSRIAAHEERERNWFGRFMANISPGIPELYARVVALNAKVMGLSQLEYPVTNVFLTFETEKDQRRVLQQLSVGSLSAHYNDKNSLSDPKYLFRGEKVLDVKEPGEPSTVRWQDLNATFWAKTKIQTFTLGCTAISIVVVAFVVRVANEAETPIGAALVISIFNSLFPMFAKLLTDMEAHSGEGYKQTSLYFKIAAFRWVNTAIVFTIITPFTDTLALESGLIPQIYALFFAEIVTTNLIQLADPAGHFKRHFSAPRAATQDAMNLCFQGAQFELAERYTDMTKLLFLCLWYCSIYPGAYFMCSFSLLIKYWVDRFSLMRTWKRAPQLGKKLSKFSRRYFFSLACVAMAIMSSYYWSGFPYDNICPEEGTEGSSSGTFKVYEALEPDDDNFELITFSDSDINYRFCNQDFLTPGTGWNFPFIPQEQPEGGEWMTEDQENITTVFGWSSLVIAVVVLTKFVWGWIKGYKRLFYGGYKSVGNDQGIRFSTVASRNAYIPQVSSPLFAYPLIACDTDDIDEELYDWCDPDRCFKFYDLSKDSDYLLRENNNNSKPGFTVVRHWAPEPVEKSNGANSCSPNTDRENKEKSPESSLEIEDKETNQQARTLEFSSDDGMNGVESDAKNCRDLPESMEEEQDASHDDKKDLPHETLETDGEAEENDGTSQPTSSSAEIIGDGNDAKENGVENEANEAAQSNGLQPSPQNTTVENGLAKESTAPQSNNEPERDNTAQANGATSPSDPALLKIFEA